MAKTILEEIIEIFAIKGKVIAPERRLALKKQLEAFLRESFNQEVDKFTSLPGLMAFAEKIEEVQQYLPDIDEALKQSIERKIWANASLILGITGPFITSADIFPALNYYAMRNDVAKLKILLDRTSMDIDPLTVSFYYALRSGCKEAAAVILAAGKGLVDSDGMTPLLFLCSVASQPHADKKNEKKKLLSLPEQIHLLIDLGVDLNAVDKKGNTALHHAAWNAKDTLVDILLLRGADREKRNNAGLTPLQLAAKDNTISVIMRFLQDTPDGSKCIRHWAARHGYLEILQHLNHWPDLHLKDNDGFTAFLRAVQAGHRQCVVYLYSYPEVRKQIQDCDNSGLSAVHWAVRNRHLKVFNWLALLTGVDLSVKDKSGKDCLAHALETNDAQIIQVVYMAKVDRHCLIEQDIVQILRWAYQQRHQETIEYFVAFINVGGETPTLFKKARDYVTMQNHAAGIAELASEIFQRQQILCIDYLSAEQAMELLGGFTPRQLAEIRRVNKRLYAVIEDEKFINPLVNAYGLRTEYNADCAKPAAAKHSRFANFFRVYSRTWIAPDQPILERSLVTEELAHAIALQQSDRVESLLASENHAYVQRHAFPLRLVVRLGRVNYLPLLQKLQAKSTVTLRNDQGQDVVDSACLLSIEAARGGHRHLVMQFLNQQKPDFKDELVAVVNATAERGHLALLEELMVLPFEGGMDITEALFVALRNGHTQIFEWLKAKHQANLQRFTVDRNTIEGLINKAILNQENTVVCQALCKLTPFLINVEDKLKWAIDHNQPEVVKAILPANEQSVKFIIHFIQGRSDAACLVVFLEYMAPIIKPMRYYVGSQLYTNLQNHFKYILDGMNSFAELQAFSDKLHTISQYFPGYFFDPYQPSIRIKQAFLLRPNRWQALAEDKEIWEFLRRCYNFSPEVQGKAAFLQAYQAWLGEGVTETVRELLHDMAANKLTRVEASLPEGRTVLHWAAANGHVAVFNWLLEKGADVLAKDNAGKDGLALALERGEVAIILAAVKAKINRHALTEVEIQAVLEKAYQNKHKEIIEFFLGFINFSKTKLPVLVKVQDSARMLENNAARSKELAENISAKLQILNINGLPGEMVYQSLANCTPRQLARLRLMDKTLNKLINDEKFINQLLNAYGLRRKYDEECAQDYAKQHSRFAMFYILYIDHWLGPDYGCKGSGQPLLGKGMVMEELAHAIALRQSDIVKAILARPTHGYVDLFAFPLRLAARLGRDEYIPLLQQQQAKSVVIYNDYNGVDRIDYYYSLSVEAARGDHQHLVMRFLNKQDANFKAELAKVISAAVEYGHLALLKELTALPFDGELDIDHALYFAVWYNHVEILDFLITKHQMEPHKYKITEDGIRSLIHDATERGDAACLAVILKFIKLHPQVYELRLPQNILIKLEFGQIAKASMLLQYWQSTHGNLFNLPQAETIKLTSTLAQKVEEIITAKAHLDKDQKSNCTRALLQVCAKDLNDHESFIRQLSRPGQEPESKIAMLNLLKQGIARLQKQKEPQLELAVATYLLIAHILNDELTPDQKKKVIQAYEAYVKPRWQTCATALVCIISGAIGLVLGAAVGIGIGMLAGSWSGPGMALTALAGGLTAAAQGAALGVAAGAAVTSFAASTVGLLAVQGFFRRPEQVFAEQVKQAYQNYSDSKFKVNATPLLARP